MAKVGNTALTFLFATGILIVAAYVGWFYSELRDLYFPSTEDTHFEEQLLTFLKSDEDIVSVNEFSDSLVDYVCFVGPYEAVNDYAVQQKLAESDQKPKFLRSKITLSEDAWALVFIKDDTVTYVKARTRIVHDAGQDSVKCLRSEIAALEAIRNPRQKNEFLISLISTEEK